MLEIYEALDFSALCCGKGKRTFQIVLLQDRLENKCKPPPNPSMISMIMNNKSLRKCKCLFVIVGLFSSPLASMLRSIVKDMMGSVFCK